MIVAWAWIALVVLLNNNEYPVGPSYLGMAGKMQRNSAAKAKTRRSNLGCFSGPAARWAQVHHRATLAQLVVARRRSCSFAAKVKCSCLFYSARRRMRIADEPTSNLELRTTRDEPENTQKVSFSHAHNDVSGMIWCSVIRLIRKSSLQTIRYN